MLRFPFFCFLITVIYSTENILGWKYKSLWCKIGLKSFCFTFWVPGSKWVIFFKESCAWAPVLWPPDAKNWLIGKDPDAGNDWRQEKGMTEDEMVGWHYWLDGHEFEKALGVCDWQGSLTCCSPWGRKESNTTEQLNWTVLELNLNFIEHTHTQNVSLYLLS